MLTSVAGTSVVGGVVSGELVSGEVEPGVEVAGASVGLGASVGVGSVVGCDSAVVDPLGSGTDATAIPDPKIVSNDAAANDHQSQARPRRTETVMSGSGRGRNSPMKSPIRSDLVGEAECCPTVARMSGDHGPRRSSGTTDSHWISRVTRLKPAQRLASVVE